jgi:hypothetical protein
MFSTLRKLAVVAAATASIVAIAPPAQAADVFIRVAPPPLRTELIPRPRAGYLWTPGYWNWNGRRHVWVNGAWVRERRGHAYNAPVWVQEGDRWRFRRGGWGDRDRDGVPNRVDRHPNNPHRR